jgi:hypothetical protein
MRSASLGVSQSTLNQGRRVRIGHSSRPAHDDVANTRVAMKSVAFDSPRTLEVYKARMMEKLDCRNLAELLRVMTGLEPG